MSGLAGLSPCVIIVQSVNRCILTAAIEQLQALLAVTPVEAAAPSPPPRHVSPTPHSDKSSLKDLLDSLPKSPISGLPFIGKPSWAQIVKSAPIQAAPIRIVPYHSHSHSHSLAISNASSNSSPSSSSSSPSISSSSVSVPVTADRLSGSIPLNTACSNALVEKKDRSAVQAQTESVVHSSQSPSPSPSESPSRSPSESPSSPSLSDSASGSSLVSAPPVCALYTNQSSEQSEKSDSVEMKAESESDSQVEDKNEDEDEGFEDVDESPAPFPQLGLTLSGSPLFSSADFRQRLPSRIPNIQTSIILSELTGAQKAILTYKRDLSRAAITRRQSKKYHHELSLLRWYLNVMKKEIRNRLP